MESYFINLLLFVQANSPCNYIVSLSVNHPIVNTPVLSDITLLTLNFI